MKKYNYVASFHQKEGERLKSLQATKLLDTTHSDRFGVITNLAATVFKVPTALISLVDSDRQWFLSSHGQEGKETHRDRAFCSHTINEKELLVVEDTKSHPIFKNHPLVIGKPYIRFYAGAVIRGEDTLPLGTLAVIDQVPRKLYEQERQSLLSMAKLVRQEIVQPAEISSHRVRNKLLNKRDPLTNAFLGDTFFEKIHSAYSKSANNSKYYVLCLEFSNIEYIENHYGYIVADEIILELSTRLRRGISQIGKNVLGRTENTLLGGFIVINLDHNPVVKLIGEVTNQLQECLEGPVKTSLSEIEPNVNVAIVQDDFGVSSPRETYRIAKSFVKNLPKKQGVNAVYVNEIFRKDELKNIELTRELSEKIEQNKLHLVYQPKIDPQNEGLVGLEALIRWNHPRHGSVSPLTIINIANKSNLIFKLEKWIFKTVANQIKKWKEQGFEVPRVSINVTGDTLQHKDFVNVVSELLDQNNLSGENLDIEIVESSLFDNLHAVIDVMNQLRRLGITFSIDDFGTGFSNLSYLKVLPINYLKIDKSFIDNIITDKYASAMCSGIISLANRLNIQTVAEGVESEFQVIALRAMRCNFIQGYYYSKPLGVVELETKYYKETIGTIGVKLSG
jgi:EAL domain-containing protein (putative c-di-GMP-specific phosphodiesterase class I)/GGDEF domain-containing protein